jgi:hypothetical protein
LTLGEQRGTLATPKLKALLLVFLVTVLASLINPETYGVYDYVLTVLRDPGSQLYVSEWQPPKIKSISGIACFYGPFFFSLLVILYSDRRLKLTEFLLYFGFAAFALTSLRNGIWFSLITAPIIASAWNELKVSQALEQSTLYRSWQNSHARAEQSRKSASLLNYAIAFSMFIGCILSSPWLHPAITGQPLWEEATPVGAVDFIEEKQLEGNIFHAQAYGDYLIWRLWPRQKSFVDGRVHLFGEELVKDYMSIFRDSCWEQRLEPYDIRYLFLRVSNESDQILHNKAKESPHWEILYEDKLSVILEKTTP